MSALATIIGGLGELSESELRQLYLVVGVRLGNPDGSAGPKAQKKSGGKPANPGTSGGTASKKSPSSKGNPKRKSQWANHPLYIEYSRLKKVVEDQAKEAKTSFNAVDTAESSAYQLAFTRWVEAKASFRHRGEGDESVQNAAGGAPGGSGSNQPKAGRKEPEEEESSEEEEEEAKPPPPPQSQAKPGTPPLKPKVDAGKPSSPAKGKAVRK
jgi:hypothetical protein